MNAYCPPYTVSADGHIVGDDGFIVPRDFAEFWERYPRFIRGFLVRQYFEISLVEAIEADLVDYLRAPALGSNQDKIAAFDPERCYGANAPRFFRYIRRLLLTSLFSSA
jgi:hypothetical protein